MFKNSEIYLFVCTGSEIMIYESFYRFLWVALVVGLFFYSKWKIMKGYLVLSFLNTLEVVECGDRTKGLIEFPISFLRAHTLYIDLYCESLHIAFAARASTEIKYSKSNIFRLHLYWYQIVILNSTWEV